MQLSISEGVVRRFEQDQRSISLYVAPKFHEMDFEYKRVIAVAFLEWNKQTHPNAEMVFFFDSRDRKRLGHYAFGNLKLDRPLR
ncbi:hypothetical protein CKO25_02740 [Thiocapsa imhoffii]|uniref:Uncharacterized protein n=1 Tax=Thiocapsa imhoffii TaxID=382777 RepID=A0A9X0WF75_9GAMM|nr:hypothetical protein [Thiocapsa imhoffii]